eukprot:XP_011680478.1 PREDICTED: uncharacterized protein LOC105445961 [Strongylocentrotus purpuratus]
MDGEWVEGGGIDSDVGEGDLQRRMEFVLTGLEPGNEYNISVSAAREGVGGEGSKSPLVSVTTTSIAGDRGSSSRRRVYQMYVVLYQNVIQMINNTKSPWPLETGMTTSMKVSREQKAA